MFESLDDLNMSTAFKVAWAGFIRLGEITYTTKERKHASFEHTQLTKSDISFSTDLSYAILRLKRSKTDVHNSGVKIVLAASGETTYPIVSL